MTNIAIIILCLISSLEVFAQDYELSLVPRRRYDRIDIDVFAKRLTPNAPKIGSCNFFVEFDTNYFRPTTIENQVPSITDTIRTNMYLDDIIEKITSSYHNSNGFLSISYPTDSLKNTYGFYLRLTDPTRNNNLPTTTGRGTFLGKLSLTIKGNPDVTTLANIRWSKLTTALGKIEVWDNSNNSILSKVRFIDPPNMTILGIDILNYNQLNYQFDRKSSPPYVTGIYQNSGQPIIFERTVNPSQFNLIQPNGNTDENVGYILEYRLDTISGWNEIGRVTENNQSASQIGSFERFRTGEIYNPAQTNSYIITHQDGTQLNRDNYRGAVRVIWAKNSNFSFRSEEGKLRITQLLGNSSQNLFARARSEIKNENKIPFRIGRNFFIQLNGKNQYLKTKQSFSNATQLTVEAWVNPNELKANSDVGIVASAAGQKNNIEGAWMLYLEKGNIPAFRVREILDRGDSNLLGNIKSPVPIGIASSNSPLNLAHSKNWTHLAATVENNTIKLYIDGELVTEYTNNFASDIRMRTTNHPIWIGVNPNGDFEDDDFFSGGIKGVKVWKAALSQDQIRRRVMGVVNPTNFIGANDEKRALELYYELETGLSDLASSDIQNQANNLDLFTNNIITNDSLNFRPDIPHIRITNPQRNAGLTNKQGDSFEIRWVAYGLSDIATSNSSDIKAEYTLNKSNWHTTVKSNGDTNNFDVENSSITWEPFRNNNNLANLRSATPFTKEVFLRIRNVNSSGNIITDSVGPFYIARYFSLNRKENSRLSIPKEQAMNLNNSSAFFEAWIKPSRFPSLAEKSFPIFSKVDTTDGSLNYELSLLNTGQLEFKVADTSGTIRRAVSDTNKPIRQESIIPENPNWVHIAVLVNNNNGIGQSKVIFYIDGNVQSDSLVQNQLGKNLVYSKKLNKPLLIGSTELKGVIKGFIGEIREIRFWNNIPNNLSFIGTEPTPLTRFIQGAINSRAADLKLNSRLNLHSSFAFNGGTFVSNGIYNTFTSDLNRNIYLQISGDSINFSPTVPFVKLVEPDFKQIVKTEDSTLRIRWIGFDYDVLSFTGGQPNQSPSLEFSIRGGGGLINQPFQFVGSLFFGGNTRNSFSLPNQEGFRFNGSNSDLQYAGLLNVSIANPDVNRDGNFADQGRILATQTNARLRLTASYTLDGTSQQVKSESNLFTIEPSRNLTIRVLFEGLHSGNNLNANLTNFPTNYRNGGVRVTLYKDNDGKRGDKVFSTDSSTGYQDLLIVNRNRGTRRFANIGIRVDSIANGNYWVVVEKQGYLPVMSRFPAPFRFEGDDETTWEIESGWDFQTWDGKDDNVITNSTQNPNTNSSYTAFGSAKNLTIGTELLKTGLVFNNGISGSKINGLAAMIAGDLNNDGDINATDRSILRSFDGTNNFIADLNSDGRVNADDRVMLDRNIGRTSSIKNITQANKKSNELGSSKKGTELQVDNRNISYRLFTVPKRVNDFISYDFYIQNINGFAKFKLANSTFAISYDTTAMVFDAVLGGDSVIFANDSKLGYTSQLRSAPEKNTVGRISNIQSIEIDYDISTPNGGKVVPNTPTFLGTLRFKLLKKNVPIIARWSNSTSIHTVDSAKINDRARIDSVPIVFPYKVSLLSPKGGERLISDRQISLTWSFSGINSPLRIEYSTNNGASWLSLSSSTINSEIGLIRWNVPKVNTNIALVRILDGLTGLEIDRSDNVFSINIGSANIALPVNDLNVVSLGGSQQTALFNVSGYFRVNLEISEDGLKWTNLAKDINGSEQEFTYTMPNITSKKARLRLVESSTNIVVAISDSFRVSSAQVSFRNPISFESLKGNTFYRIRWNASNVKTFLLQYSTNAGFDWNNVATLQAASLNYNWRVPNIDAPEALLRIVWDEEDELEFARSSTFEINRNITSIEDEIKNFKYTINENQIEVISEFEIKSIILLDLKGSEIISSKNKNALSIIDLPKGVYILQVSTKENTYSFKIIK